MFGKPQRGALKISQLESWQLTIFDIYTECDELLHESNSSYFGSRMFSDITYYYFL